MRMRVAGPRGRIVLPLPRRRCSRALFVPPTLIELDSISDLKREVFGPVLHVVRFQRETDSTRCSTTINATGYGLTLGVHSRIDETIERVIAAACAPAISTSTAT